MFQVHLTCAFTMLRDNPSGSFHCSSRQRALCSATASHAAGSAAGGGPPRTTDCREATVDADVSGLECGRSGESHGE